MNNRYPLRNIPVRGRDYTSRTNPAIIQVMDLLNAWLPPTPMTSPDEMVIQQRGRRRSPTKHARLPATTFNTDFQSFESPPSDSHPKTPAETDTPLRYAGLAGIRKRLMMTPESEEKSPSEMLSKTLSPPYKKPRIETNQRRKRTHLKLELSALSNQQLINVITSIAEKYSLQKDVRSALPPPDVTPLIDNLEFFSRNIRRSLPTSRLLRDVGFYRRVKTHIDNFKQACVNQGRQLEQCCAWRALVEYVKAAWMVVQRLPMWCHGNQNKARLACFRSLTSMIKIAVKSEKLMHSELEELVTWCEERKSDYLPLVSCAKNLRDSLHQKSC